MMADFIELDESVETALHHANKLDSANILSLYKELEWVFHNSWLADDIGFAIELKRAMRNLRRTLRNRSIEDYEFLVKKGFIKESYQLIDRR